VGSQSPRSVVCAPLPPAILRDASPLTVRHAPRCPSPSPSATLRDVPAPHRPPSYATSRPLTVHRPTRCPAPHRHPGERRDPWMRVTSRLRHRCASHAMGPGVRRDDGRRWWVGGGFSRDWPGEPVSKECVLEMVVRPTLARSSSPSPTLVIHAQAGIHSGSLYGRAATVVILDPRLSGDDDRGCCGSGVHDPRRERRAIFGPSRSTSSPPPITASAT
jgi:hypothetical protein